MRREKAANRAEWNARVKEWKKKYPLYYERNASLKPEYIIQEIYDLTKNEDTIVTTGVGQNQMWAAQYYKFSRPRRFISSGGLGTMGFGMPAALGAQIGQPKAKVVVSE